MHVTRHSDFASLVPYRSAWNELSRGVPFCRWEWLETWWRHYGSASESCLDISRPGELYVLTVHDEGGQLQAIAPWYRLRVGRACSLRFLGEGEVCTDYLSVLCRANQKVAAASALAEWLTWAARKQGAVSDDGWDRMELEGVDAADGAVTCLLEQLALRGNLIHHTVVPNTWRVTLPRSWEFYLMLLSKPHRRRLRQADRSYFQSGRVTARHVRDPEEIPQAFGLLVDLHQRRWQRRGQPGRFASPAFAAFHREASRLLAAAGQTLFTCVELDGEPLSVEYQFESDRVTYAYQAGIDPDRLDDEPGHLAAMAALREAIGRRQLAFDFLRGDEAYKAHWRATPRPSISVRVIPPRAAARLRHSAWVAGQHVKHWIKTGLSVAGNPTLW